MITQVQMYTGTRPVPIAYKQLKPLIKVNGKIPNLGG